MEVANTQTSVPLTHYQKYKATVDKCCKRYRERNKELVRERVRNRSRLANEALKKLKKLEEAGVIIRD